jgi:hypothetical protein
MTPAAPASAPAAIGLCSPAVAPGSFLFASARPKAARTKVEALVALPGMY